MYRRRPLVTLYALVTLSWLIPLPSIELHVAVTFMLYFFAELYREKPMVEKPPPEPDTPPKARRLSLLDAIPLDEDNS